eukprot:2010092-Amphidinium_carterae.1
MGVPSLAELVAQSAKCHAAPASQACSSSNTCEQATFGETACRSNGVCYLVAAASNIFSGVHTPAIAGRLLPGSR